MKKEKTGNAKQLMARIESGEITDQKMWSYIKELNSASEERLNATAMIATYDRSAYEYFRFFL